MQFAILYGLVRYIWYDILLYVIDDMITRVPVWYFDGMATLSQAITVSLYGGIGVAALKRVIFKYQSKKHWTQ